jgi:tellurite resistance protein
MGIPPSFFGISFGLTGLSAAGRVVVVVFLALPTVAGGRVGAYAAATVGLHALAAAALVPTLAIELLLPAGARMAWFGLDHDAVDVVARGLGGYAVLMALVQLRFVPAYLRLRYTPGFGPVLAVCPRPPSRARSSPAPP